ncbi:MAG TPA: tRNA (adenine-N1)-methyltransferase [Acidimicrobiia bacterium]|nr:tRNA (adenine-N1)-methyltransferase [Acidimicrobiia bacterium]
MGRPLRAGERVMLVGTKEKRYLLTLEEGAVFHLHTGTLPHDTIIGVEEGSVVRTSMGAKLVALRPTLAEYILKMPRGAQVIYPKDIGPILMLADIRPGHRVFESGVGSGALTMALLRTVGPEGRVIGYEARDDFAARATRNIEEFYGAEIGSRELPLTIEVRDSYEGIDEQDLDRIVLDLPEPWQLVKHAEVSLRPGGIFLAYLPTIGQVAQLSEALEGSRFGMVETLEVLHRTWHVTERSVRPDHRMVAHTGFLTHARLLDADAPRR